MGSLWRVLSRTVLWSYERGTVPYDLMVAAIVLFVLLAPRPWFDDQPRGAARAQAGDVRLVTESLDGRQQTYRVAPELLAVPPRSPEMERQVHDLLRKSVQELRGRQFQIEQIRAVRDGDGTVLYYEILIRP